MTILATPARAALGDRIAAALNDNDSDNRNRVRVARAELQHPYYHGLRFLISARSTNGDARFGSQPRGVRIQYRCTNTVTGRPVELWWRRTAPTRHR